MRRHRPTTASVPVQFTRRIGTLTGGAVGLGLSTVLAWAGASSGLESLSEVSANVEDLVALAVAEVLFAGFVLTACAVTATATAHLLTQTLDRWLQLAATGHCQPPSGESPAVAIGAHLLFTALSLGSGAVVLRAGLRNEELNWTVEGLLLILIGGLLGIVGMIPWAMALFGADESVPADDALQAAGADGLLFFIGTATFSIGVALALLGWIPTAVYGPLS